MHLFKTVVIKVKVFDLNPVVSRMELVTLGGIFLSLASVLRALLGARFQDPETMT